MLSALLYSQETSCRRKLGRTRFPSNRPERGTKRLRSSSIFKWWLPALVALLVLGRSHADVLDNWNEAMLNAIREENTPPALASRNLAILHLAIYDAVNSIEGTHQPYLSFIPPHGPASPETAAAAAGHETALALFPSERAAFDALWLGGSPQPSSSRERTNSIVIGLAAARALLEQRASDGSQLVITYFPSNQPGAWRRTPPFYRPPELPNWRCLKPFAMRRCDQFRPPPPPKLGQSQYAADFNEVKRLGGRNSAARTPDETEIAQFWSDFTSTVTTPGHWNQIARVIAGNRGLRFTEKTRMLALLNLALADAAVVAWDAKYGYNFWRPITAIHRAVEDANPQTTSDPAWQPLVVTPPFPEYVSGHSTFSGAAAAVLAAYFGGDKVRFRIGNDSLPGLYREYHSLSALAAEIGHSRILGGIHFPSAEKAGRTSGRALGTYVFGHFLRERSPSALPHERAQYQPVPSDLLRRASDSFLPLAMAGRVSEPPMSWTGSLLPIWTPY
jgi:membrane-associated phospholipid phosphatase